VRKAQPAAGRAVLVEPEAWQARQFISSETGRTMSVKASAVPDELRAVRRIMG
jgi:hypothetical protein